MPEPAVGIDRVTAMQPVRVQLARVPVIVFEAPYGVKRLDPAAEPGMSADVIKVEGLECFDWWRSWEATEEWIADDGAEKATNFNTVNRNKRGITLELEHPEDRALLLRLVATAMPWWRTSQAAYCPSRTSVTNSFARSRTTSSRCPCPRSAAPVPGAGYAPTGPPSSRHRGCRT